METTTMSHDARNQKIWVFNAGLSFAGNPKWLFAYIQQHRPDIQAHWLCDDDRTVALVRRQGWSAHRYNAPIARVLMRQAGIYVVEQFKEHIHAEIQGATILNLWHGVGCKSIERKLGGGFLRERVTRKHIVNHDTYLNHQLFLTTSPLMERHFVEQCALPEHAVLRGGYPRCHEKAEVRTFDHDLLARKGLPAGTRIVAWCPTFREKGHNDFFSRALPDMERLLGTLEEHGLLLVLKVHPMMEGYQKYKALRQRYARHPRLLFWDLHEDFYEVMDRVDVAIVDYSSIFYDLLAAGTPKFVRYFFDHDQNGGCLRDFVFDCREMTCGTECTDFEQLLEALATPEPADEAGRERIRELFWSYARPGDNERLIEAALSFRSPAIQSPDLHSFDVFDTLIQRTTLEPAGVFHHVQRAIRDSGLDFPEALAADYPNARKGAESNVRYMYRATVLQRGNDRLEIAFGEIFARLAEVYALTPEQVHFLREAELEAEWLSSQPCPDRVAEVLELLDRGQTVVLMSDMYLPEDFIRRLLAHAEPRLADLPLFLSSSRGTQKSTGRLYMDAFAELDYRFGRWVHHGDNPRADGESAAALGISPVLHSLPEFDPHERELVDTLRTYDAFCVAALMARFRQRNPDDVKARYAYSRVSMYMVTYVMWALRDALERGIECLYFIARDGHHLKRIADAVIRERDLPLRTRYLHGSRQAWWVASYIDGIDPEFFASFDSYAGSMSFHGLLEALRLDAAQFAGFFPDLTVPENHDELPRTFVVVAVHEAKNSDRYRRHLLELGARERVAACGYLASQIDFSQRFAFVEYWGRGYTQDCLARLLEHAAGRPVPTDYYYARSIYRSEPDRARHNLSVSPSSLLFVETLFANLPYASTRGYEERDGAFVPVVPSRDCDLALHEAMERELPAFAADLCRLPLQDEAASMRQLFDWSIDHFARNRTNPAAMAEISHLSDSLHSHGTRSEFSPALTLADIARNLRGEPLKTQSLEASLARSPRWLALLYVITTLPVLQRPSGRMLEQASNLRNMQA
jgi:CDP-glycerol glycerophosphotransferase (TagB/SpsB family)/FMN phosphatase YigB (HAD superfamily)